MKKQTYSIMTLYNDDIDRLVVLGDNRGGKFEWNQGKDFFPPEHQAKIERLVEGKYPAGRVECRKGSTSGGRFRICH